MNTTHFLAIYHLSLYCVAQISHLKNIIVCLFLLWTLVQLIGLRLGLVTFSFGEL